MQMLVENQFGYLLLKGAANGNSVYIKANKITSIDYDINNTVTITTDGDLGYLVTDTIEEILAQLENVHPSLR